MQIQNKTIWLFLLLIAVVSTMGWYSDDSVLANGAKQTLSEYAFFKGKLSDLIPADHVFEYEVNAPLFSDYAEKKRMIYLPPGMSMQWQADAAFDFPRGAAIIKNFFYWNDPVEPDKGRRILETRLLLKEENGWKALEYVWNTAQTEAFLEVAGSTIPMVFAALNGKKQSFDYTVPNVNQCKGCHSYDGQFVPIGITARQLNRVENGENQLLAWNRLGHLTLPVGIDFSKVPSLFDYRKVVQAEKESTDVLEQAARGYLDGNCAHCHNPHGPASTSGMFLEASQTDRERLGVGKPPVAAGRGSGNRKYGIVPGKPGESILFFRMESDDPGIRMPELGRQLAHREGLDIIKNWIKRQ